MLCAYDRGGIAFATWSGPGRDPEVAYLDADLLAITSSELGRTGLRLYGDGLSYNVLGGERRGAIDPAALHRIVHAAVDGEGAPLFELDVACDSSVGIDGLCDVARRRPRPGMPAEPSGSIAIEHGVAVQWTTWQDSSRQGVLRRAVYLDERYVLEAGCAQDGLVRAWPARGLPAHRLELVTPTAKDLAVIETHLGRVTGAVG